MYENSTSGYKVPVKITSKYSSRTNEESKQAKPSNLNSLSTLVTTSETSEISISVSTTLSTSDSTQISTLESTQISTVESTQISTSESTSTTPVPPLDCSIKFEQSVYEGFDIEEGVTDSSSQYCGQVSINYNQDCYPKILGTLSPL